MDKPASQSSASAFSVGGTDSTLATTRCQHLKNLNKQSHKISKPVITTTKKQPLPFDHNTNNSNTTTNLQHQSQSQSQQQNNLQPPVYNINKSDFRDLVQKLTGSPVHDRFSTPSICPPKPPSSRLQRIRPPPLANVTNRPPAPIYSAALPPLNLPLSTTADSFIPQHPSGPLSLVPPFPAVHPAAESPVSAYMRYLQNSISAIEPSKEFSGFSPLTPLVSPRWNNLPPPPNQPPEMIASQPQFQLPTSPLPFGCFNSPRSPHHLLSPGLLLSPSVLPWSPILPVRSPR